MSVSLNAEQPCRGRGRPPLRSDEETLRLIVDAASSAFRDGGYAGTGMSTIAARAGISTKTLYRVVPTKEELFRRVISSRVGRFILMVDEADQASRGLEGGLERLLVAYGNLAFDPEVISVYRLVVGECVRFPEIGRTFLETAIKPAGRAIADWLARQSRLGLIVLDDPERAADVLRGMMVFEPQRAALLGQAPPPDAAAIEARARFCATLFLRGCRA
jgi:AcrR family transcriptional regulator